MNWLDYLIVLAISINIVLALIALFRWVMA